MGLRFSTYFCRSLFCGSVCAASHLVTPRQAPLVQADVRQMGISLEIKGWSRSSWCRMSPSALAPPRSGLDPSRSIRAYSSCRTCCRACCTFQHTCLIARAGADWCCCRKGPSKGSGPLPLRFSVRDCWVSSQLLVRAALCSPAGSCPAGRRNCGAGRVNRVPAGRTYRLPSSLYQAPAAR
jgi:hypothetical protein